MDQESGRRKRWTEADVPDQRGRIAVITGGNSGIGLETARVLAERGATVVLACRDIGKARDAAERIRVTAPGAEVKALRLDLGSLASVREAAQEIRSSYDRLDLLINNAGVMSHTHRRTADGFELQFGTNHLGHFALTGLLLDRLLSVPGSRIVTVSSVGHRQGDLFFDDLHFERKYQPFAAYGQSKLANLMFTYELQRRLATADAKTIAVAAHPGGPRTGFNRHAPGWFRGVNWGIGWLFGQSVQMGAQPTLRAAVDPDVRGGDYYGPAGLFELEGSPKRVESSARSHDIDAQRRLWEESRQLTGVTYSL